jgi:hypothetical protein
VLGTPCLAARLAAEPDCIVEDVPGQAIPPCDGGATRPCWQLEADPARCPSFDHLRLEVLRAAPPAPGTVVRMRCIVAP